MRIDCTFRSVSDDGGLIPEGLEDDDDDDDDEAPKGGGKEACPGAGAPCP
jgi:hypothetical protein